MTTTEATTAGEGREVDGVMPIEAMEAGLASGIQDHLESGFDQAVDIATEAIGARKLFSLPAAGLVEKAERVAVVWLGNEIEETVVFAVLDQDGSAVRIEQSDGAMEDMSRLVRSYVEVLGRLQHLDLTEAEAA